MKILIPILLCASLLISCNGSVESDEPAETSFTPTKDNVIWQADDSYDALNAFWDNGTWMSRGTYGEIEILGVLNEIMTESGDQRIAVQIEMVSTDENIGLDSVFKNLPEGYADTYGEDWGGWPYPVYFLTAEDIKALSCEPNAKVAVASISYEDYQLYKESSNTPVETTAPETSFAPTEDNVLWGNEKDYNALRGGGHNFGRYTDYDEVPRGEVVFRGSLKDLMAEAGECRIAVMFDCQPDDGIEFETVFKNLPEGYAEKYHVDGNWVWPVYFLTVEDINKLYCDPATKIAVSSVTYEEYLEYEYLAKHTYPPDP